MKFRRKKRRLNLFPLFISTICLVGTLVFLASISKNSDAEDTQGYYTTTYPSYGQIHSGGVGAVGMSYGGEWFIGGSNWETTGDRLHDARALDKNASRYSDDPAPTGIYAYVFAYGFSNIIPATDNPTGEYYTYTDVYRQKYYNYVEGNENWAWKHSTVGYTPGIELTNGWNENIYSISPNYTIKNVIATVIFGGEASGGYDWYAYPTNMYYTWTVNEGWFSFCIDYDGSPTQGQPWLDGTWINSSISTHKIVSSGDGFADYSWDITNEYPGYPNQTFTLGNIFSHHFVVMWTFKMNTSIQYINYIGIQYTWKYELFIPDLSTNNVIEGLIWLLMVFLPAIVMSNVIPRIGFSVGIILMLVILGITSPGFFPVTILGLIAVGILNYKGG